MIINFTIPKNYLEYRRNNIDYLIIKSDFFETYAIEDRFNILLKTERDNLHYIDELNNNYKKYKYKSIEELKNMIIRNNDKIFIYIGNEEFKKQLNI